MKKIAIFQANLQVGGIQRSLVNLMNSGIFKEYEVDVYLFSRDVFYDIETIPNNIHIKYLQPFPYWYRFLPFGLIKMITKCEIDLSGYDFAIDYDSYRQECAYYTTSAINANKIMWIHNDMVLEYKYNRKYRVLYHFFKNKYRYYDQFVAVSEGIIESFKKQSKQYDSKVTIIPNIINVDAILKRSQEETEVIVDTDNINIVCVGRIYVAKGYEFLLEDFSKAYEKNKKLRLYIIGEGPDLEKHETWVKKNRLEEVVYFLGKKENPFAIMNQMDAFCLESRYEGQGMVLWEAKCLGLQLIFPRRLEKYNIYLKGVDDVQEALIHLEKRGKEQDYLEQYHEYIEQHYKELLC